MVVYNYASPKCERHHAVIQDLYYVIILRRQTLFGRQGQKLDRTASPGSDHLDQLGLTQIGLKILRGTWTDLKIFRRYKKYDLPQTSSCIGLHFMQQQPGKIQDCAIRHFVTLAVPCFLGFQYWFPVSRCNSQYLHHAVASVAQHSQFNSCRDQ